MAKQLNRSELTQKEELLVFGYSCKLFRDDEKASYVENEEHLIPWMGNPTLMIDRYDVRGALYDLEAASACDSSNAQLSEVEAKEEELCEQERYLALYHDLDAAAEREEEESKRLRVELEASESTFNQVGFTYGPEQTVRAYQPATDGPQQGRYEHQGEPDQTHHHPHGYTPQEDDDTFIPPPNLVLPPSLTVPTSIKQHKIIVKTAKFIAKQGSQMEIVLKTKQANNYMFGFLSFDNKLNPYYKHMVSLIKMGKYTEEDEAPRVEAKVPQASFNPPESAPGVITPKSKAAPAPDCSYSKLISKIRENQAKAGNLPATDSRPESPSVETQFPTTATTTTPTEAAIVTTVAGVTTATSVLIPVTTAAKGPAAAEFLSVTATTTPAAAATDSSPSASTLKTFTGLVDYPSFNRTNDDDSHSDTDSEYEQKAPTLVRSNGSINGDSRKENMSAINVPITKKPANRSNKKDVKGPAVTTGDKITTYDDIRWPRPSDQMTIDKIACYIVKNGPKFEKAVQLKGDPRFQFLESNHDHHSYYRLKLGLYTEVFGASLPTLKSSHSQSVKKDLKSVVALTTSVGGVTLSKSWSSSSATAASHHHHHHHSNSHNTISFSIKQRKDQEVTLPATSFPLESSSSEEEPEELDDEARERRANEREERRRWRKNKREQFEKDRKEKKEREERERKAKEEEEKQRLKELEEQENASGNEEMYDIFKYAQESGSSHPSPKDESMHSPQVAPTPAATTSPPPKKKKKKASEQKLRRKKAAHAFLSKLKTTPEEEPIIGPQLPPEIAAQMMDISPVSSPHRSPSPSSPTSPPSPSHTPPPLPTEPSSSPLPPTPSQFPSSPPPLPPATPSSSAVVLEPDTLPLDAILPPVAAVLGKKRSHRQGGALLAAAVSSLLTNEESALEATSREVDARRASGTKSKRHKSKHRRDASSQSPDRRSSRQRSAVASKKRKRKRSHSRHHKKRRHHSPHRHHHHHSSSHRKSSSSQHVSKKKKSSKSSSSKKEAKSKKKKSRRQRSESISSQSSISSSSSRSSRSRSRSRSSSSDSYRSSAAAEPKKKKRSRVKADNKSDSDHEVQVISDSDSSNSSSSSSSSGGRSVASSVVSVRSGSVVSGPRGGGDHLPLLLPATPSSSRASSTSRDAASEARAAAALTSGPASPAPLLPPLPLTPSLPAKMPLPANFDPKTSTAVAKITQGLRAKVHALMDKKRPDD